MSHNGMASIKEDLGSDPGDITSHTGFSEAKLLWIYSQVSSVFPC